jgi:hypothetical protein
MLLGQQGAAGQTAKEVELMSVPDPIELGEAAMERWADENVRGDHFRCAECGLWQPLEFAVQATPNPYSPAICGNCAFASDRGTDGG